MKSATVLRRIAGVLIGVSLLVPATTSASGVGPDFGPPQDQSAIDASQRSVSAANGTEQGGSGPIDDSTNCYGTKTPFITGTVRDTSGNPVAGASVSVTLLGLTFPNPAVNGPFDIYRTKADGTYSICAWGPSTFPMFLQENSDRNGANAMVAVATPPAESTGTTMGSQIALLVYATSVQKTPDSANPLRSGACLDPARNTSEMCKMDFVLETPIITAKAKTVGGDPVVNAAASLEYFYRPNQSIQYPNEDARNAAGVWVQLGFMPTNSTGDFGMSGFVSSNRFRLKIQAPECGPDGGQTCPFADLASVSDTFAVTVTTPGNPATGTAVWESNSQTNRDFVLPTANLRGQITDGIGADLYGLVGLTLTKGDTTLTESTQYSGRFAISLGEGTWDLEVAAPSWALGTTASYSVTVTAAVVTSISRTSDPAGVICSDATTSCYTGLKLSLTPPNFLFTVRDSDGNVVEGADLMLEEYAGSELSSWPWTYVGSQQSGKVEWGQTAGLGGFSLANDKIYRIQVMPPWDGSSDLVRTDYYVKVSADGSEIRRCAAFNYNPSAIPCQLGWTGSLADPANLLSKTDGKYTLTMAVANFRGFVCAPGDSSSCTVVPQGNVNVMRWQEGSCQGCTGWYQGIGMGAWAGQAGTIALSFETEGRYKIDINPPFNSAGGDGPSYAKNSIEFYADEVGNSWKFYTLDANGAATSTELSTVTVASATRIALRLTTPSFVGLVQAPGGEKSSYSWVEVRKEAPTEFCPSCSEWLGGATTNQDGVFALSLDEGKHVLTANPSWTLESSGLTRTELKISALDCNSDGTVEIYTYSSSSCGSATLAPMVGGKIVITLKGANFTGILRKPDGDQAAVASTGVDLEKLVACTEGSTFNCGYNSSGYWTWSANDWTDQNGRFGFSISEAGTYRVTFRAPYNLQSTYSSSRMELEVSGDPAVVIATPDASVFSYDTGTGDYTVKLKLPNVSGTVTLPFDAEPPSGNDPAVGSWINAEKWDANSCFDGCYQWSSEVNGSNTNDNGDYGITLPEGRWKLTFNPPWGESGVAKATREVVVSAAGTLCLLSASGENGATCPGATVAPGALDVELPSPNFSGTVKNPDNSVSAWSSIQFQKWEPENAWWQWTNLWANTDINGKFGVNMTENGSYRVTFEPSWQASGVSAKTIYIRVCDGGSVVETKATETDAKTGLTCSGSGTLSDPTAVYSLVGANMQGIVIDGSNSASLGDAWIAIQNCDNGEPTDWCNWERGVNTKGFGADKGEFAVNLSHTSGGSVTKYRIEINPPWNTTAGLVRGYYNVWVKDFNVANPGDEWCLEADYNSGAGTCSNPRSSSSDQWSITLTAGNLAGKMLAPTGSDGIAYGWMQIEKWTEQPWNDSNYYWQWTNYWVNTNQLGNFGLDIPGTDAGLYRVTANPGWDNPNGYARRRYFIRVAANGQWCEQPVNDDLISDDTPYSGAECTAGTDNVADSVTGLTVRLSTSNLSGTLYTSATDLTSDSQLDTAENKVRDAWMSLQVKRTYDWNGAEDGGEWTYWEWLGGSNTSGSVSSRGKFGLNIEEDGEYRLDVQPSWRDTSGLDGQFYVKFTAATCNDGCNITLTPGQNNVVSLVGGTYAIKYPSPNFKGTIKDKTGANAIAGAWLNIYRSDWEWVTGLSTGWNGSNVGKFGTRLDDGTYRVEVWPRWDDTSSGMRRVVELEITGGVVTSCSAGCSLTNPSDAAYGTITLRGENLSGTVYYPGATDSDIVANGNQTPMPWAWAEVRTCGDAAGTQCEWGQVGVVWRDSQGTNENGLLRLGLDPATNPYLVTVWPNWGYYSASPLRLLVSVETIDATVVTKWKYESENLGYNFNGTAFNPDFGRIPPNLEVTVSGVDAQRFVELYECVGGTNDINTPEYECGGGTWQEVIIIGTVKIAANTWKSSFTITAAGGYKVVALRTPDDVTAGGTLSGATSTFTHTGSALVEKTITVRP